MCTHLPQSGDSTDSIHWSGEMNRSLLLLALCFTLIGQFTIVLVSGLVERHPPPSVHTAMGAMLIACTSVHLLLHRGGLKFAITRFRDLPRAARAGAILNFALFAGYMTSGVTGLFLSIFPAHGLSQLHLLSGLSVAFLQAIHLSRHHKWIQNMLSGRRRVMRHPSA